MYLKKLSSLFTRYELNFIIIQNKINDSNPSINAVGIDTVVTSLESLIAFFSKIALSMNKQLLFMKKVARRRDKDNPKCHSTYVVFLVKTSEIGINE